MSMSLTKFFGGLFFAVAVAISGCFVGLSVVFSFSVGLVISLIVSLLDFMILNLYCSIVLCFE